MMELSLIEHRELKLPAKSQSTLKRAFFIMMLINSRLQPAYAFSPDIYVGALFLKTFKDLEGFQNFQGLFLLLISDL